MARRALALATGSVLALALAEGFARSVLTVRDVGPSFTLFDPLSGARLKPAFTCIRTTPEFRMRFTTNRHGARGPEVDCSEVVLFLGDSFTMGYGVNDGEEYPAIVGAALARREPPVSVWNAGIGGTGNGRWLGCLERMAAHRPRLVVLQVCDNDLEDNLAEELFAVQPDGELRSLSPLRCGLGRHLQALVELVPGLAYSHLMSWGREVLGRRRGARIPVGSGHQTLPPAGLPGAELTRSLIGASVEFCRERGWPVLAITCAADVERLRFFLGLFAELEVECLVPPSKQAAPDLYYRQDGHWNAAGHARMASLLLEQLEREPLAAALSR